MPKCHAKQIPPFTIFSDQTRLRMWTLLLIFRNVLYCAASQWKLDIWLQMAYIHLVTSLGNALTVKQGGHSLGWDRILEHCSILLRKPENSCIFCYSVNKQLQLENKREITITSLFCLKGHTLFVNIISNMY